MSYSTQNLFRGCPRKGEFRKFHISPEEEEDDNIAGPVGTAIHAGYQEYLKSGDDVRADFEMMMHYPFGKNADENHDRSVYAAHATLQALIGAPILANFEIAKINVGKEERAAIEVPFVFEIENFSLSDEESIPVTYVGKIDAVLFNRETQEFGVVDIKTHRRNLKDLSGLYIYDDQCIPYALVLEKLLGKELTSLEVKYASCFVDLTNPSITLYPFLKGPKEIEDWGRSLVFQLQQLKMFYNIGWFPRNPGHCMSYNRKCQFLDICHERDPLVVRKILLQGQENFEPKPDHFKEPWVTMKLDLGL